MPKRVPRDCIDKLGLEWLGFLQQMEPSKQQPVTVTIAASPAVVSNSETGDIVVSGGTVSNIELSRNGAAYISLGLTSGMFRVTFNDLLRITYTVAPAVHYLQV
jgi:hypothetical protein